MSLLGRMSQSLKLPPRYITRVAKAASHSYKTYTIAKRDGTERTIHHPSKELKALQRWLLKNVINLLPVHEAAMAYRKGRSVVDNARVHVNSRYLLRMDFDSFFPSLTESDIRAYIARRNGPFQDFSDEDTALFCDLVCRNGRLTIGAPTSPALSNVLCWDLDTQLSHLAARQGASYTRYADDLFLSASRPQVLSGVQTEVEGIVERLCLPANLRIKGEKTRHSSKRGTRRVTGVVLGSDGALSLGRSAKRRVRSQLHKIEAMSGPERVQFAGFLSYCRGVEPDFVNRLIIKYGAARVKSAMSPPR